MPLAGSTGTIGREIVGVSLNGITLDPPAPVDRIKAVYTIAALDDCGGHVNPVEGWHYHAATSCVSSIASSDTHSDLIAYALDGYGIYALADASGAEPTIWCALEISQLNGLHSISMNTRISRSREQTRRKNNSIVD